MHTLPISLLLICLFSMSVGYADEPVANQKSPFMQGLEAFKAGDFARSRESFGKELANHPQDPTLLYNLGLVELSDKHPGRALAYWRKALYLSPGFAPVLSGMAQLKKEKALNDANPLLWLYWRVPLSFLLGAVVLFFVVSGFLLIRYASNKKLGKAASPWLFILSTLVFAVLAGFALHDYQLLYMETKATIMDASVPAFSSPSPDAPSLFEFREGDEVIVRRTQNEWLQVQKSATNVGWVKKNQLLIHSGT